MLMACVLGAVLACGSQPEVRQDRAFPSVEFDPGVPTPDDFLGYDLGAQFTRHHDQTAYLRALDEASDRIVMSEYGRTYEDRPLHTLVISSPENLSRLDAILEANRRLSDPTLASNERQRIVERNPAIAWFSYNVHGNEPSPAEAAMWVAYELAAGAGDPIDAILRDVVLVIDPMVNADGHERYVNFYRDIMGAEPDPDRAAAEHNEPWPGGRTNHYLFDLNRDWLWLVHPESRGRLPVFRRFMPQLHIDFHEQEYRNPYFLGAGDDPYNANIPSETRAWVERYGQSMAQSFDSRGLPYSTRERFDYLYVGYGKVLPCYNGAIGMLCEQAGHGQAGVAIEVDEHYTLTLTERARNHYLTGMAALAYTAAHRREQLERFANYFSSVAAEARAKPETYFIDASNDPARLALLRTLCESHGIVIEATRTEIPAAAGALRDFWKGELVPDADRRALPAGTWVIRTDQPMGRLARAIFERTTHVSHPETYDISGWCVPLFFGLDAWYSNAPLELDVAPLPPASPLRGSVIGEGNVALILDASSYLFPAAAGLAMRHELYGRIAMEDIIIDGRRFSRGSLVIHLLRNAHADLDEFINQCLNLGIDVHRVSTGLTQDGPVLGANENQSWTSPRIALVRGSPVNSLSFGEIWHLLDVMHDLPHTVVNHDRLGSINLAEYDVLVLPDRAGPSGAAQERIKAWVQSGGTLVCIESASTWAATNLLELDAPKDPDSFPRLPDLSELSWKSRRDRNVEESIPGVPVRILLDTTHPLTAGVGPVVAVIKDNDLRQRLGRTGYAVGRYDAAAAIGMRMNERQQARLAGQAFMTVHSLGSGRVIGIGDSVTTRGFTHGPARLLLNAIIYGPSL